MVRRLAWLGLVVVVACGSSETPTTSSSTSSSTTTASSTTACIPGEQRACACPGGAQGAQVCSADGLSLGACTCPGAGGTGHGGAPAGGGAPGGAGGAGTGGATSTGGAGGTMTGSGGSGGMTTTETAAGGAGGAGGVTGSGGSGGAAPADAGAPDAAAVPYAPDFTSPWTSGVCVNDGGSLTVDCDGDGKCEAAAPPVGDCGMCAGAQLVCPQGFQCQDSILGEKDPKTPVIQLWTSWCKPL